MTATNNMYTLLLAFAAVLYSTKADWLNELCTTNSKLEVATYIKHPTDCDKFIQCHLHASDGRVAETQKCAFPTYWNTDILSCVPFQEVMCDMCISQPDGLLREGNGNCRGYWECQGRRSEAKCCPLGQKFNRTESRCVETTTAEEECKDSCMGIVYESQNETANETVVCEKLAISGNPGFYKQFQVGWGLMTRPCAPGTAFNQTKCECVTAKAAPVEKAKCKPEVHLTFSTNETTINGYFIDNINDNVLIKDGVADFNGVNSRLSIPRFDNIEHSKSVVIRIKYASFQDNNRYPQAILSNSGCGKLPSILISEDDKDVIFQVGTTKNLMTLTSVPQPTDILPTDNFKTVEFKFLNGVLTGSVNNVTSSIPADGYMRNVHCSLNVGFAENMSRFKGQIDELSVFLCDPEMQ